MTKILKKLGCSVLILTLTGIILGGCNSSSEKTNQITSNQTVTKNNELDKNDSNEIIDQEEQKNEKISDDTNKKADMIKEPEKLKDKLSGNLGDGEVIKDIIVKDKYISLKVDLGTETNGLSLRDLAESRYAGLSEKLLLDKYWTKITVDFIGVGSISMDTKDAVDGQYFKGVDINKVFKN